MNTAMCYFLIERRTLPAVDKLWVFRTCENVSHWPTHKHDKLGLWTCVKVFYQNPKNVKL